MKFRTRTWYFHWLQCLKCPLEIAYDIESILWIFLWKIRYVGGKRDGSNISAIFPKWHFQLPATFESTFPALRPHFVLDFIHENPESGDTSSITMSAVWRLPTVRNWSLLKCFSLNVQKVEERQTDPLCVHMHHWYGEEVSQYRSRSSPSFTMTRSPECWTMSRPSPGCRVREASSRTLVCIRVMVNIDWSSAHECCIAGCDPLVRQPHPHHAHLTQLSYRREIKTSIYIQATI